MLYGYIGGPKGFINGTYRKITKWTQVKNWLNQGGCEPFSYGSSKEYFTEEALATAKRHVEEHKLRALVIVGGPADLTWAHHLSKNLPGVTVIGVPKSKNANFYYPYYLPITLGFDSSQWMLSEL